MQSNHRELAMFPQVQPLQSFIPSSAAVIFRTCCFALPLGNPARADGHAEGQEGVFWYAIGIARKQEAPERLKIVYHCTWHESEFEPGCDAPSRAVGPRPALDILHCHFKCRFGCDRPCCQLTQCFCKAADFHHTSWGQLAANGFFFQNSMLPVSMAVLSIHILRL